MTATRVEPTAQTVVVEQWERHLRGIKIGGRALWYLDVGTGPTVLLIHGLGASWHVWAGNLEDLSQDHRVIAVDLPGFGSSERPPRAADLGPYASDVVELLYRLDSGPVVVIGHSLGGIVAQRVASQLGAQCPGLVLVSSAGMPMSWARLESVTVGLSALALLVRTPGLLPALWRRAGARKALIGSMAGSSGAISDDYAFLLAGDFRARGFWRGLGATRRETRGGALRSKWPVLTMPTLVLWGDRDQLLPPALGQELARRLPSATYEEWAGVGHSPNAERPADFNTRIRSFVEGLSR